MKGETIMDMLGIKNVQVKEFRTNNGDEIKDLNEFLKYKSGKIIDIRFTEVANYEWCQVIYQEDIVKQKVYIINGYSKTIGHWEVELFLSKEKAEKQFAYYVDEYDATVSFDDEWYASCDDGVTWMSLEEREIK